MRKLLLLTTVMSLALLPALQAGEGTCKDKAPCCDAAKAECCKEQQAKGTCPMMKGGDSQASAKQTKKAAKAEKKSAKAAKTAPQAN